MFCFFQDRWNVDSDWESSPPFGVSFEWRNTVERVMKSYTEATDGSFIESKESALVWNYQDADFEFGSCQAKELSSHLESLLANDPVVVRRGHYIVEVIPQVCLLLLPKDFPNLFYELSSMVVNAAPDLMPQPKLHLFSMKP